MAVKKILVSQQTPSALAPYTALETKFGVRIEFRPFFLIEDLSSREFRAQRVNVLDYTAVVFSARHTIDAFFHLCEELRFKIPETMKYFCTTEAVAMYLQKHIVYRKRKIFFGTGTPQSVVDQIGSKHKGEKFLIAMSASSSSEAITSLFDKAGFDYRTAVFVKPVSQDLKEVDLHSYDAIVLYNPASKHRPDHLRRACELILTCQPEDTVCGYVRNIGRDGETAGILTLAEMRDLAADMFMTVFIGNSETRVIGGKMVTPRGYRGV
jgi:uroporphyrinogen-III synthase